MARLQVIRRSHLLMSACSRSSDLPLRFPREGLLGHRKEACLQLCALTLIVVMLSTLACEELDPFVDGGTGGPISAAVDLDACEILASLEFGADTAETGAAYTDALRHGRIVQIANGTRVSQGSLLNFQSSHLVLWTPPGEMTVAEMRQRHIGVYEWLTPKEGPYKGQQVCVASKVLRFNNHPPLILLTRVRSSDHS